MLQALIVKKVLDLVMKRILKKFDLDGIQKYVSEPNDLDIKMKKMEQKMRALEKIAHPRADFVCTTCGGKAKRKINKIRRK